MVQLPVGDINSIIFDTLLHKPNSMVSMPSAGNAGRNIDISSSLVWVSKAPDSN